VSRSDPFSLNFQREAPLAPSRRECLRRCLLAASLGTQAQAASLAAGFGLLGTVTSTQAAAPAVLAAGPADVMADYQRFLGGRDPLQIQDLSGPYARRDVAEVILLHQALHLGGWRQALEFRDMPSGERLLREIGSGSVICSATSYWKDDIAGAEARVSLSLPLVGDGEFEAGLYTVASNQRALAAKTLADVQQLSVLSNRNWVVDWRTLDRLGVADRQHVTNWELMPKMVAAGRADFLLAPFQATADLSLEVAGVRLIPIPGLKIGMQGTRHFLISAKHAQGPELKSRLDAGLQALNQQGRIRRAYVQSGFFNPKVLQWRRL
jgi:hypothetical protein